MKAKEFGAWPPRNDFKSGQRYSANGFNKSFKKERFPQAQEYANQNVEEYKHYPETVDLTAEGNNEQAKKDQKTKDKSKARQKMLQQVVGIAVGSTVIVTSYQARVERLAQENGEPVAVVADADEVIPEEETEEELEEAEESEENEEAASGNTESNSKSGAKSLGSKGSSSSRGIGGRGGSRSSSGSRGSSSSKSDSSQNSAENSADSQNAENAAVENQNTNDASQSTAANTQSGGQSASVSGVQNGGQSASASGEQSGGQSADNPSGVQNGETNVSGGDGLNITDTDNSQSGSADIAIPALANTHISSGSSGKTSFVSWKWSADNTSATLVVKDSSDNVISSVTAKVTSSEKPATCKQAGKITYTARASAYGSSYTGTAYTDLPPLGHSFDSGKEVTLEGGQKAIRFECTRCHEYFEIRNSVNEE